MKINLKSILLLSTLLVANHVVLGQSLKDEYEQAVNKEQQKKDAEENERKRIIQEGINLANQFYKQNKLIICGDKKKIEDILSYSYENKVRFHDSDYSLPNQDGHVINSSSDGPITGSLINGQNIFFSFINDYLVTLELSHASFINPPDINDGRILNINSVYYIRGRKESHAIHYDKEKDGYKNNGTEYYPWTKFEKKKVIKWSSESKDFYYNRNKLVKTFVINKDYELRLDELAFYTKYTDKTYPSGYENNGFHKYDCTWIDFQFNKIDVKAPQ